MLKVFLRGLQEEQGRKGMMVIYLLYACRLCIYQGEKEPVLQLQVELLVFHCPGRDVVQDLERLLPISGIHRESETLAPEEGIVDLQIYDVMLE